MMVVCWKCLKGGRINSGRLWKVGNAYVFACENHKDVSVPEDAYSLIKNEYEEKVYEDNKRDHTST